MIKVLCTDETGKTHIVCELREETDEDGTECFCFYRNGKKQMSWPKDDIMRNNHIRYVHSIFIGDVEKFFRDKLGMTD